MNYSRNYDTKLGSPRNRAPDPGPAQSPYQVQLIFVLTLLLVVFFVMAESILGGFSGLNIGEDFGLILGGTIACGICVGVVAGALHDWNRSSKHR